MSKGERSQPREYGDAVRFFTDIEARKTINPLTHNLPPVVPSTDELVAEANADVSADYAAEHTRVVDEMIALRPLGVHPVLTDGDKFIFVADDEGKQVLFEKATIEQLMFAVVRYQQRMKAATHFAVIGERKQSMIRIEGATAEFKAFCNKFRLPVYFGSE